MSDVILQPSTPTLGGLSLSRENGLRYLTPEEMPSWDAFVDSSPQGSVFCRSWWLKAVGGDVRVLAHFEEGRIVAGIPLYFKKRAGLRICTMPKLVQTWGVLIEPLAGKEVRAASREMEILRIFANRLKQETVFLQSFHPSLQNWLPFYWNGFTQTSRFTYALEDLTDLDGIWKGMRENIRTDIRKAQKLGLTVETCGAEQLFEMIQRTFVRQKLPAPFTSAFLMQLFDASKKNRAGECFRAKDNQQRTHAAAFLVWDRNRAYYLAGGADSDLRHSGASSFLLWHLIQFAAERSRVFDFEGSVSESIERFFRAFGARQVPYCQITNFPVWLRVYRALRGRS